MKCFFDENLGKQLALGLRGFGEDAIHLTEVFAKGTPDEEWLPFVAEKGYILFTLDKRIRRSPLEKALIKKHKIGAFFLMGKTMSRWNYIRQIVRAWHKIETVVEKENPPYAYQVTRQGTQVNRIPLE
jgi:predicted nuclease of predicted toxin-antitoxin system